MNTDRELLELAAKAIGYSARQNRAGVWQLFSGDEYVCFWNPLTDDGDALRLAVKLGITDLALEVGKLVAEEGFPDDKYAATRRAIVRAAAQIGRAMP